jgi:polyisoprenoid-binding protein YceI
MNWNIDPAHTEIIFSVRHMMITNVRGRFDRFDGTIDFDEADPTNTAVDIKIEAASINTNNSDRDTHLRSADFLNAEQYPHLAFKSKAVEQSDSNHARLIGDLTIGETTREVRLDVEYFGQAKSPWGVVSAGFKAETSFNRKSWGLEWNHALETGGWLVGEMINITIEAELMQQAETA